jgi:hypothetical protein
LRRRSGKCNGPAVPKTLPLPAGDAVNQESSSDWRAVVVLGSHRGFATPDRSQLAGVGWTPYAEDTSEANTERPVS